jgi:hypothetical protein
MVFYRKDIRLIRAGPSYFLMLLLGAIRSRFGTAPINFLWFPECGERTSGTCTLHYPMLLDVGREDFPCMASPFFVALIGLQCILGRTGPLSTTAGGESQ